MDWSSLYYISGTLVEHGSRLRLGRKPVYEHKNMEEMLLSSGGLATPVADMKSASN